MVAMRVQGMVVALAMAVTPPAVTANGGTGGAGVPTGGVAVLVVTLHPVMAAPQCHRQAAVVPQQATPPTALNSGSANGSSGNGGAGNGASGSANGARAVAQPRVQAMPPVVRWRRYGWCGTGGNSNGGASSNTNTGAAGVPVTAALVVPLTAEARLVARAGLVVMQQRRWR